jgi:GTP-binding protein
MNPNTFLVIGLPNGGKSSIINCLTESTPIISDTPGTTVDFIPYPIVKIPGAFVVDTAGYTKDFVQQNKEKMAQFNHFIFVVDGAAPVVDDHTIFINNLRKIFPEKMANGLLILNKIDKTRKTPLNYDILDLYNFKNILEMSAMTKSGVIELINYIRERLVVEEPSEEVKPKIAILGKTNVGKSTLMNLLSKNNISVVKDSVNTTVDPIDFDINLDGKSITLQDTAGFSTDQKIKFDGMVFKRTMEVLKNCNIAIIMTDHERGITNTDMTLMGLCKRNNKAFIVVINKWDQSDKDIGPYLHGKFFNHEMLQAEKMSCTTNFGIGNLKKKIKEIVGYFNKKIETRVLNEWVHNYLNFQNLSMKIKYITQTQSFPPTFAVNMNFKNIQFMALLQKHIRKTFYNGSNVPVVIKLIR